MRIRWFAHLALLLVLTLWPAGCTRNPRYGAGQSGPSPFNDIVAESALDLDFTLASLEGGALTQVWELAIPWSREGLGGADHYFGVGEEGIPLRGGASPPDKVLIAPGPTIAVGDRGLTRLYDQEGRYLGSRPGAIGFLPDGGLVTLGKPGLAAYSSEGTLLWALDPWRVVQERLGLGQRLVPNSGQALVSPAGVIYYFFDYQVTGHDGTLAGLLVVDARGQIVGCEAVPCAVFMRFLPEDPRFGGEFLVSTGVGVDRGQAYRVFSADGLVFTLHRTVYVASGTIYAAAADGSYLVRNPIGDGPSLDEAFTVYREGAARALSFCLPEGHHYADWTPDGRLYSVRLTEDCLIITAWSWPVP